MKIYRQNLIGVFLLSVLTASMTSCGEKNFAADIYIEEAFDTDIVPVTNYSTGLYGYVDKSGEEIISARYKFASYFHEGMAVVKDTTGLSGYINKKGDWVIDPKFKSASSFNDGLAWVALPDSALTAIDSNGKIVFSYPKATEAEIFIDGMAVYKKYDDTYGLVSKKGVDIELPEACSHINVLGDGYVLCFTTDYERYLGHLEGEKVVRLLPDLPYDVYKFNMPVKIIIIKKGDKYGLANIDGKIICNPQYELLECDAEGMFIFKNSKDKIGWLNSKGEEVIKPKYSSIKTPFSNLGYTAVTTTGSKWQIIDRSGNTLVGPKYDDILPTEVKGILLMKKDDVWGLITKDGTVVCNPQFEDICAVSNCMFMASTGGSEWGVIDDNGTLASAMRYYRPTKTRLFAVNAESNYFNCEVLKSYVDKLIPHVDYSSNFASLASALGLSTSDVKKDLWGCEVLSRNFSNMGVQLGLWIGLDGPCLVRTSSWSKKYEFNKHAYPMEFSITLKFNSHEKCIEAYEYFAKINNQSLDGDRPTNYFIIYIDKDKKYRVSPYEYMDCAEAELI